jgi:hypothetical protein
LDKGNSATRKTQPIDMDVTGHTKFFCPIMFFSVDITYFGERGEYGAEQNEGRHADRKAVPGEQRCHIDTGQRAT